MASKKYGYSRYVQNYTINQIPKLADCYSIFRPGVGSKLKALSSNPNQIGEIIITQPDGTRYVYGLPVNNIKQVESTFSVHGSPTGDNLFVTYSPADNGIG